MHKNRNKTVSIRKFFKLRTNRKRIFDYFLIFIKEKLFFCRSCVARPTKAGQHFKFLNPKNDIFLNIFLSYLQHHIGYYQFFLLFYTLQILA